MVDEFILDTFQLVFKFDFSKLSSCKIPATILALDQTS